MTTIDERRGTIFAGRYRLERKLGSGGMADVWLAEDQELGRKVAIKMLHERYANDTQFVERFRREATHAAGLSHPNVVSIFDRGETDGSYYIVMEYVEGRTLKELLVTRGPCPVPVAISYVRQVLAALRYAHRNGIVHRDIKPHNVLVDHEGRVKVADFGIARAGSSQMTEAGSIIGTAQYLSPEQARGAPVDESSDLYSTGIVLYELLTGDLPFNGETPVEIAMKHLSQVPPAPSTIRPEIPRDLDLVVLRALAKEPAERYRSAKEMDRDLELVGRGEPVGTETEAAATMVLRGETTAATTVRPVPAGFGGDERYRSYEGEVRTGRAWWPWLVALGAAVALGVIGWFVYDDVRDRIDANEPIAVDNYTGILEENAVDLIVGDGFEAKVVRRPNGDVQPRYVFQQEPEPGTRLPKDSIVTVLVSTGKPKVTVPFVVGKSRDTAVAELTQRDLDATVVEVNSERQLRRGDGAEPPRGHRAGLRLVRADQRLEGPEADRRAERRRLELRARRRTAPVGRVHRRSGRRGEQRAVGDGRHAEPAGELDRDARLVGDALGLARAVHRDGARRLLPDRRRRTGDLARLGIPDPRRRVRRPTTSRSTASSSRRIRPPRPRRTPTR